MWHAFSVVCVGRDWFSSLQLFIFILNFDWSLFSSIFLLYSWFYVVVVPWFSCIVTESKQQSRSRMSSSLWNHNHLWNTYFQYFIFQKTSPSPYILTFKHTRDQTEKFNKLNHLWILFKECAWHFEQRDQSFQSISLGLIIPLEAWALWSIVNPVTWVTISSSW